MHGPTSRLMPVLKLLSFATLKPDLKSLCRVTLKPYMCPLGEARKLPIMMIIGTNLPKKSGPPHNIPGRCHPRRGFGASLRNYSKAAQEKRNCRESFSGLILLIERQAGNNAPVLPCCAALSQAA